MDFLLAVISFFLGVFITVQILRLLKFIFPKTFFRLSPKSTPKNGGRFNFYLRKWKEPICSQLGFSLFFYITDLVSRFLSPNYFGFWKAFVVLFLGVTLIILLIGLIQCLFDFLQEKRIKEYEEWIEQQGDTEK